MHPSLVNSFPAASPELLAVALPFGKKPQLPELPGVEHSTLLAHAKGMNRDSQPRYFSYTRGRQLCWLVLIPTNKHRDTLALRIWVDKLALVAKSLHVHSIGLDIDHTANQFALGDATLPLLVQRACYANYSFDTYKTAAREQKPGKTCKLVLRTSNITAAARANLTNAQAITQGQALARDLGNLAPNDCTIDYLHKLCQKLAKQPHFTLHLVDKKRMQELGFGAFLAVAKGSTQDPKLLVLEYRHPQATNQPLALLGKGLTFDSGGISLKPAAGMEEMKFDMCGAASVLGACQAIASLQPRLHALFALALAENMPGSKATRPGDVVQTLSGKTVEVINTDAEGRLVLCDSLTWLQREFSPTTIVDIATLTGACVVALGHHASALYTQQDKLARALLAAAQVADDGLWRMPLWREYQQQLSSNLVDIPNISSGRDAGSITAACFLSRFVDKCNWAHLDIAGTAWISGKNKLATGRPTALLTRFLLNHAG